jgi:thiol-disulfide isomerase/thioredoxin
MRNVRLFPVIVLFLALGSMIVSAQETPSPYIADPHFPAAEFPPGLDWLNVPAPLTMAELRGKIVLLHFWSSDCIPCLHMLPILSRLQAKYGGALVVIGIHSPKFHRATLPDDHLRQTIIRYGIDYPVVDDPQRLASFIFGVNSWPTLVLVDPRGNILAMQPGETAYETLDAPIAGMQQVFDSSHELDHTSIPLALENQPVISPLAFPGGVLADSASSRLFISDTGHNRLIVADLSGAVLSVVGSGQPGLKDGGYIEAQFNMPQGMALDGQTLYVADTGNHAIRAVDLAAQTVSTIAGTGVESEQPNLIGDPLKTPLNTPWSLALDNGVLFITMAGEQQLWGLLFARNVIGPVAGVGIAGLRDGPFDAAQFAQPSGLYADQNRLYVTDGSSSSIRQADLSTRQVTTLAGPLNNTLDAFGDVDGAAGISRLQYPLAITGSPDGTLYIADTYNNRIRALNPNTAETTTLAVDAQFDEPSGISYADGKLYVADTYNHAIRVIDLVSGTVSTLMLAPLEAPTIP